MWRRKYFYDMAQRKLEIAIAPNVAIFSLNVVNIGFKIGYELCDEESKPSKILLAVQEPSMQLNADTTNTR